MKNTKKFSKGAVICILAVSILLFSMLIVFACTGDDDKDSDGKGTEEFTITFDLGYTPSNPPASIKVKSGSTMDNQYPGTPKRTIWDFKGWKDINDINGTSYNRSTVITSDLNLKATWSFTPGPVNPIFTNISTTDPAPFYDEASDTVYVIVGQDILPNDAASNDYFRMPGWHMYKTQDMKTFEYVEGKYNGAFIRPEHFPSSSPNTGWAAQLIKGLDGRYYFYVTTHQAPSAWPYQICVAVADSIEGDYTPHGSVLITESMVSADIPNRPAGDTNRNIDPTVFIDDDGTAYIVFAQVNPRVAKLKSNMVEIERPMKLLFQSGWKMADPEHHYEEGPWIYKRDGKYYLFFASGHMDPSGRDGIIAENISYAMLESGTFYDGVWSDGIVISEYAPGTNWQGNSHTIHPGIVDFNGMTYMFYHSQVLPFTGLRTPRSVHVDYLYFDEDGKPRFLDGVRKPEGISIPPKDF